MTDFSKGEIYFNTFTQDYGGRKVEVSRFINMLEVFCDTGEIAGRGVAWPEDRPWLEYDDPLMQYLVKLMSDPEIKVRVLTSRTCAKVFFSTVGRFIIDVMHHQAFLSQCLRVEARGMKEVEDLSEGDKRHWQKLIASIGEKRDDDGFDSEFHKRMAAEDFTQMHKDKMIDDWCKAVNEHLRKEEQKHIKTNGTNLEQNLNRMLSNVSKTMMREGISDEQAVQAWKMINGQWTETEFLRKLNEVRLQERFPQLQEVVMKMGHIADSNGKARLAITNGRGMKISHSSGNDITGITVGADLGSLLPIELATYADPDMEDIFFYRYTKHRLQTFDYKSRIAKPSRRLSFVHARRIGPMIVCVDTSASMFGAPQRIIASLLSLLEEKAEILRRDCYLIDFSVSVKAIDLKLRIKQNIYESIGLKKEDAQFKKGHIPFIGGGTDAHGMMDATFMMLANEGDAYVNADVLWISDFLIPLTKKDVVKRMQTYRKTGTRFYGLCIRPTGEKGSDWTPYFDKIYNIEYRTIRKY